MKHITLETLKELNKSVYETIDYAKSLIITYPDKPKKPILAHIHSSKDVEKYQNDLKQYENELEVYKKVLIECNITRDHVYSVIEEYIKDASGFYDVVPKQYQDKVYSRAWTEGHSYGYGEVYAHLTSLVEIFE